MKHMTKRDVADIAIVWVGLRSVVSFLSSLAYTLGFVFVDGPSNMEWGATLPLFVLQNVVQFVVTFVLLFRRRCILDLLFPLAGQTEINISAGCAALTDLAFWIRLSGTFLFLSAFVEAFTHLSSINRIWRPDLFPDTMFWQAMVPRLVAVVLPILIVWQADRIAALMNKLGKSNKMPGA